MAFLLEQFNDARPFLYHLTDSKNLVHMRETGFLKPAAALLRQAGRAELLRTRRSIYVAIHGNNRCIVLRDQTPLHRGNIKLLDGYEFEDFVESLNNRVFFWSGNASGPSAYGMRHFKRYEGERPVILRLGFQSLLEVNSSAKPLFCAYNSGSPRCFMGEKSPRGRDTFLEAQCFGGTISKVVEVTFDQEMVLPSSTEYGRRPDGRWKTLFG